jgi:hypothetical protein
LYVLSFKYSKRQNDLTELEAFLKKNNLINPDTVHVDSSYFLVEPLVVEFDSLNNEDSIVEVKGEDTVQEEKKEIDVEEEIEEEKDSVEEVIEDVKQIIKQDSIPNPDVVEKDTVVIAPILEMPSVTQ